MLQATIMLGDKTTIYSSYIYTENQGVYVGSFCPNSRDYRYICIENGG